MGKLIEKEGRFYKECGIVMLESKSAGKTLISKSNVTNRLFFDNVSNYEKRFQHLYITSDDEINCGDWVVDISVNKVLQINPRHKKIGEFVMDSGAEGYYKIIATTDTSLCLPQPSQSFIQKYIDAYNNGNPITNVMVEYDYFMCENGHTMNYKTACVYPMCGKINHQIPKINLKNNTITISKVKDSWTREEMEISHLQMSVDITKHIIGGGSLHTFDTLKWIEENL